MAIKMDSVAGIMFVTMTLLSIKDFVVATFHKSGAWLYKYTVRVETDQACFGGRLELLIEIFG